MLFTQIIAFILVMAVFEAYQPGPPDLSLFESLLGWAAATAWLWLGARLAAGRLVRRLSGPRPPADPARAVQRLETQFQAAATAGAILVITVLDFKAHVLSAPLLAHWDALAGLSALLVFLTMLAAAWSAAHGLEERVLGRRMGRWAYMKGQARFAAPVVFPWLAVSLLQDLAHRLWPEGGAWLGSGIGDLCFLAVFILAMGVFLPPLIRLWWGCRPWPPDRTREIIREVLRLTGVRVGAILSWPVMGGGLLTAGLLGVVPRFRYLLITPALAEALSPMELAAVTAHEAGHARHGHLPLYMVFFICFFVAAYALSGPMLLALNALLLAWSQTEIGQWTAAALGGPGALASLLLALPLAALLAVYLRYVMGFFMRNFERQADFFALKFMGEAAPLAGALEKTALLSGGSRDTPSWHHFSISQRVRALREAQAHPALITAHARMLRRAFGVFFACLGLAAVLGIGSSLLGVQDHFQRRLTIKSLEIALAENPRDPKLHIILGVLQFEDGREKEGIGHLRAAAALAPRNPEAINGLAWLLATARRKDLRRPKLALKLALEAVALSPQPHIWDTLAEAYFINGRFRKALAAERAALAAGPRRNQEHYRSQLERFQKAAAEMK